MAESVYAPEQIDAKLDAFDKVHAEFTALLIRHERKKT